MGTYTRPDKTIVATGEQVYAGIQEGLGKAMSFFEKEATRKEALVNDSIATMQEQDNDINKLGLDTNDEFDAQILKEAELAKAKINDAYNVLSDTWSTGEERAAAKKAITEGKQFPKKLASEVATIGYVTEQFKKSILQKPGSANSISKTNDLQLLEVSKDLSINGGKNTSIKIDENTGTRTLVTTVDGTDYELNISKITNALATNKDYEIFKTTADSGAEVANVKESIFGKGATKQDLVTQGVVKYETRQDVAGKTVNVYTVDYDRVNQIAATNKTYENLVNTPEQYNYANSLWMDVLGNKEPLSVVNKKEAATKMREFFVNKAVREAGVENGFSIAVTTREPKKYAVDSQLKQLSLGTTKEGKKGAGLQQIEVDGVNYRIFGTKLADQRVVPLVPGIDAEGKQTLELIPNRDKAIRMYKVDDMGVLLRNKKGQPLLNYEAFRALTEKTLPNRQ